MLDEMVVTGNPILGDFNSDYVVDFNDFGQFANSWLSDPTSANWDSVFDLDDGQGIGIGDLVILSNQWMIGTHAPFE